MAAIADDIELSQTGIARALTAAADIRSGDTDATEPRIDTPPTTLAEALAEAINLGASILGRGRANPFDPSSGIYPASSASALLELARFNAAVLVTADFLCSAKPVSSAAVSFGVRGKAADVVEEFVGIDRALMLLAGVIPVAAVIDNTGISADERESTHAILMRSLEWGLAEYAALAQHDMALANAA